MFDDSTILLVCVAGGVALLVFFVLKFTVGGEQDTKLRDRLSKGPANTLSAADQRITTSDGKKRNFKDGFSSAFVKLGQAAAEPFMPKNSENLSSQRHALHRAGIYSPAALRAMNGAKPIF